MRHHYEIQFTICDRHIFDALHISADFGLEKWVKWIDQWMFYIRASTEANAKPYSLQHGAENSVNCHECSHTHTHAWTGIISIFIEHICVWVFCECANAILLSINGFTLTYSFKWFVYEHTIDCRWWIRNIINGIVFQFRCSSTPDQNIYKQLKLEHTHTFTFSLWHNFE